MSFWREFFRPLPKFFSIRWRRNMIVYNKHKERNQFKREKMGQKFKEKAKSTFAKPSGIDLNEALKILQIESNYTVEQVEERFKRLLNTNDPAKGGSFYLQCKIQGARNTLLEELEKPQEQQEQEEQEEQKEENTEGTEKKE
ncbi:PAM16 [Blepharisma stoltei]|uniref:Mitochondrial import inner membrane translocase subunit Tim16 n=1 Tax=Blepharisma stoltei TaxID=1481888 RepID=A0AAU9J2H0_9CILI|nr:unnamed protein product [Blepharisma stoltei]